MAAYRSGERPMGVPPELARSTPRPVQLSAAGRFIAGLAVALVVSAVVAFALMVLTANEQRERAAAFEANGRTMDAEIVSVRRGDDSRRRVRYRYEVSGRTFEASAQLHARPGLVVGARLPIVYLPETPDVHYLQARGFRQMPFWLVPVVPVVLLLGAAIAYRAVHVQRRLVEDGRPAVATVTGSKKQHHQHGSYFTVTYEFQLMNGSSRRGSYSVQKNPPEPGTPVVVIYDRERPERNKRYPTSLVRVAASG